LGLISLILTKQKKNERRTKEKVPAEIAGTFGFFCFYFNFLIFVLHCRCNDLQLVTRMVFAVKNTHKVEEKNKLSIFEQQTSSPSPVAAKISI